MKISAKIDQKPQFSPFLPYRPIGSFGRIFGTEYSAVFCRIFGIGRTLLWRVDIQSYEFHVSFIRHSTTNSISGLSGTLTLHRGMLYLFLVPNHENLLGYYFKHANSWQMTSISLQNQTIVPIECESLAIMCTRDRYVQMALINN